MVICTTCGKKPVQGVWSRHKKGSSGHGGEWNLKAHVHPRTQSPNLHNFKGKRYCTKCLRITKAEFNRAMSKPASTQPASV